MFSLLLTFLLISIVFSFLCSLWEAVLLSITPAWAQIQKQQGSKLGARLQAFKADIDRPLAAILTLNTIAHTVGAIGVGAQATRIWADTNPVMTGFVVPALMTLAILILSEIIPKTIGASYWKELAPFTASSLRIVILVLSPLVWLSRLITRGFRKEEGRSVLSRSDFIAMAELGAKSGVLETGENRIIASLLNFNAVTARDIMTPRTVIRAGAADMSFDEFYAEYPDNRFSRIPVYAGRGKDQITGYVLTTDMLASIVNGKGGEAMDSVRRDILVVSESTPLPAIFSNLLEKREHLALVVDEYGGTAGVVTMEDVIETLLGLEIVDESDATTDMQALARKSWEERARKSGLIDE